MITQETQEGLKKILSDIDFQWKNLANLSDILILVLAIDNLWSIEDGSVKKYYNEGVELLYAPPQYKLYIIENRQSDLLAELKKHNITAEQLNDLKWKK